MASRKISIVFAVEGEKQYREAIANINRELKTLKTDLDLVTASFKGNLNTQTAIEAQLKVLNEQHQKLSDKLKLEQDAYNNCAKAADVYGKEAERLAAELQIAKSTMDGYAKAIGTENEEYKKAEKAYNAVHAALTKNNDALNAANAGMENHQQAANRCNVQLLALNEEIKKQEQYLTEAAESSDHCATSIDGMGNATKEFEKSTKNAFATAASAISAAGLDRIYKGITNAMLDCVKAAADFEVAITGVYKTVDGTQEQLDGITQAIKNMATEIPMTTTELAKIAETAGQLGIATDDIMAFTEVIAALSVSTNLSAEDAATNLARFANITGMLATEYSNFASSLVDLGNNFATTEADIMNMAMRISSAGTQIGLSEADILGFATALSSLGMEAEMGGSAFSTAVRRIALAAAEGGEALKQYADIAGMTAKEFGRLWSTDTAAAISAFIDGLAAVDSESESTITLLDDIGFSTVRLSDAWTRLASNGGFVTDAVKLSNEAWKENVALTEEASKFYETFDSKVQMLKNAFDNLKIAVGDQLKDQVEPFVGSLTDATNAITGFVEEHPAFVTALEAVAAAAAGFAGSMAVAGTAVTAINAIKTALVGLSISVATLATGGAIVAAVAAIGTLIAAMWSHDEKLKNTAEATESNASKIVSAYQDMANDMNNISFNSINEANDKIEEANKRLEEAVEWRDALMKGLEIVPESQKGGVTAEIRELDTVIAGYERYIDALTDARDTAGELGMTSYDTASAMEAEAEAAEATAQALEELSDAHDELESNIGDLYDAVETALRNQYKEQYEATKEYINEIYEAEKEASEERLEIYKEEYDQKKEWLEDYADAVEIQLNGEIAAIKELTNAEKAADKLDSFNKKIEGYDKNISAQTKTVQGFGDYSGILEDYSGRAATLAEKYNQQIVANQNEGLQKTKEAQEALAKVTEETVGILARLNSDSDEYARAEYERAQKIADAEKAVEMAKLSVEETQYMLLKQQYKEEIELASEKSEALKAAMAEAYAAQLEEAKRAYEKELAEAEKAEESKREKAKQTAEKNYENAKSAAEKQYESAVKSAEKLYDYEEKRAEALVDQMQSSVESVREQEINVIKDEMDALERAADEVQDSWDKAYEEQKKHEQELQKQAQLTRDANLKAAEDGYNSLTNSLMLAEETVRLLKESSEGELVSLLDKYNEDFASKSQTSAEKVIDGIGTTANAVSDKIGDSVQDALTKLSELEKKIAELEGVEITVTEKLAATTPVSKQTEPAADYSDSKGLTLETDPHRALANIKATEKIAEDEANINKNVTNIDDKLDIIASAMERLDEQGRFASSGSISVNTSNNSNTSATLNIGTYNNTLKSPAKMADELMALITQRQKREGLIK